ncbi:hypothetical protein OAO87_04445, partial [bacterium]|nr:hypothetical protein [bacterium]
MATLGRGKRSAEVHPYPGGSHRAPAALKAIHTRKAQEAAPSAERRRKSSQRRNDGSRASGGGGDEPIAGAPASAGGTTCFRSPLSPLSRMPSRHVAFSPYTTRSS